MKTTIAATIFFILPMIWHNDTIANPLAANERDEWDGFVIGGKLWDGWERNNSI
jgi:hypothetical protein